MGVNSLEDELEGLIDSHSLARVLDAIAAVCCAKHQHIEENWQDRSTAAPWKRCASAVERSATVARDRGI